MGRIAETKDAAIDIAIELFQRKGYERASIEDLVQATGLNRYAIYQAFGGKRDLLIAALNRYHEHNLSELDARLAADGDAMQALRLHFDTPLREMVRDPNTGVVGSLICQAAFEVAPHDAVINARMNEIIAEKRAMIVRALDKARGQGRLAAHITPDIGADLLMTMMFGVAAQAHAGAHIETLALALNAAFAALAAPEALN